MQRFDIVKGDTTTVGGIVEGGDGQDLLNGREQAYEHDPVWCPVCKTMGAIQCDGARISTFSESEQIRFSADVPGSRKMGLPGKVR